MWRSYDDVTVNSGSYYPDIIVGGVVDFRLFQYPEGPRPAMKWTERNVFSVDDRLKNIPYPDPTSPTLLASSSLYLNTFSSQLEKTTTSQWECGTKTRNCGRLKRSIT
jgi:hypothetical protein